MKIFTILFSVSLLIQINLSYAQKAPDPKMNQYITNLMSKMTLNEKIGQLNLSGAGDITTGQTKSSGISKKIREGNIGAILNLKSASKIREVQKIAVEESRLKIPLLFGMDVIHGYQTVFPIPLGLSCSWDLELIEQSARIAAQEATADGLCWTFAPMVDISRDPRWGRMSEGSGEDPFLGAQIAKSMVKGFQGDDFRKNNSIMACVKHFALYGAVEAGREYNTTDMSRIRMYNEYFPPYKAAVDAGVGSAMASFNEVDGLPATANKWLMTDVLRKQWGFKGFVVTDYTGIAELIEHGLGDLPEVSAQALRAGIDLDMVSEGFLTTLKKSIETGRITKSDIENGCRRILEAKYKLGLFENPFKYCDENRAKTEIFTPENRQVSREIASQSLVLLKNNNQILPLKKGGTIAVIGPLADNKFNMTGTWSVAADFSKCVSLLAGIKAAVGNETTILTAWGTNILNDSILDSRVSVFGKPTFRKNMPQKEMIDEAVEVAKKSDVIVAAVGECAEMSGECSSRSDIALPENQRELLKALLETGKPVVMVLFNGRPLALPWENEHIPTILEVWFSGTEAGNAIADVLFGKVNPSGKLTATFPRNVGQIPIYYSSKNTGRPLLNGTWFTKFRSNYLDVSNEPVYPFGYGLSYTTFNYNDLKLSTSQAKGNQVITATVNLTNSGKTDGAEIVQLYIRDVVGSVTRPLKELKGFQKVFMKAGETKPVTFNITPEDLKFYNGELKYDWEPGEFVIMVGGNSKDVISSKVNWQK